MDYRHFETEAIGNDGTDDWVAGSERDVELKCNGRVQLNLPLNGPVWGVVVDSTFRVGARVSAHTAHAVMLPLTVHLP